MAKVTLTDIGNISGAESTAISNINNNSALIEAAIENTLSRDGTTPNSMEANLNMNSNRIINLPAPDGPNQPATKAYVDVVVADGVAGPVGPTGPAGPPGLDGALAATGAAGSIQFSDGTGASSSDETLLFWTANNRLGVGTDTPATRLDVDGVVTSKGIASNGVVNTDSSADGSRFAVKRGGNEIASFGVRSFNTDSLEVRGPASDTTSEVVARYDATGGWFFLTDGTNRFLIDQTGEATFNGDVLLPGGVNVLNSLPVPIATRTAMKALDTTEITQCILSEEGRQGVFQFRLGNYADRITADTQEGIFVKSTAIASDVGSWVRVYDGEINVNWFGAVGDGSTNNQPMFLAAINVLKELGGGTLLVPVGVYAFNSALQIPRAFGIKIKGVSRDKSILTRTNNLAAAQLRFYLGEGNSVENLTIDCDGYDGRGIFFQDRYSYAHNVTILDCPDRPFSMNGGGNASYGLDSTGLTSDSVDFTSATFFPLGCKFTHCRVIRCGRTAYSCKRMRYFQVISCYAQKVYSEAATLDVGSTHSLVAYNTFVDICRTDGASEFPDKVNGGFLTLGVGGTGGIGVDNAQRVAIIGNSVETVQANIVNVNNRTRVAINLVDNIGVSHNTIVMGNSVKDAKLGVWAKDLNFTNSGCSIVANTFHDMGTAAGTGSAEFGAIWLDPTTSRNNVSGNASVGQQLLITDNGIDNDVYDGSTRLFTPSLLMGGEAVGLEYSSRVGRYTRVGRNIRFQIEIVLSVKGSSTGALTITGLPKAAHANAITNLNMRITSPGTTASAQPFGVIAGGTTVIDIYNDRSLGAAVSAVTDTSVSAAVNNKIIITGDYEVE